MQKKLIALALASLAGSAFAQSNVTVYGVADATYDNFRASTGAAGTKIQNDGRISTNSSYIGFKGVEDLGNGLKAVFQIESGISFDQPAATGAAGTAAGNTFATRDSFVGIAGGFGTVVAGNLTAAGRALGAKVDVNSGATGVGYQGALLGRIGAAATTVDDRTSNAIAYVSPSFSGFNGMVAWGAGSSAAGAAVPGEGRDAATRTDNVYSLGLNYENGPIYVGYAYTQVDALAAGIDVKAKSNRLGAKYSFGMGQVGMVWDRTDADTNTSNNARNVWTLNGKFGVGTGNVIAGYGKARDVDGLANTGATHYFVGYEHTLSKRTILKAVYSQIKNEAGVAYNYYVNPVGGAGANALAAGMDPSVLQVGVRHSF